MTKKFLLIREVSKVLDAFLNASDAPIENYEINFQYIGKENLLKICLAIKWCNDITRESLCSRVTHTLCVFELSTLRDSYMKNYSNTIVSNLINDLYTSINAYNSNEDMFCKECILSHITAFLSSL
jgi:hypothetical protein